MNDLSAWRQMYKVFVNKTPIVLTENIEISPSENSKILPFVDGLQIKHLVEELMRGSSYDKVYLTHFDVDQLWACFLNQFIYVHAAGGLVFNSKDAFLMIHRNEKWDVPKGHLEKGELPEEGAVREVEEECGINGLRIVRPLTQTLHMYERNGMVLKKTFWYVMRSDFEGELVPQTEEGIDQVAWKEKSDIPEMMRKSYPTIQELLEKAMI